MVVPSLSINFSPERLDDRLDALNNRNLELINPPPIEFAPKIKFGPDPDKMARIAFAPKIIRNSGI